MEGPSRSMGGVRGVRSQAVIGAETKLGVCPPPKRWARWGGAKEEDHRWGEGELGHGGISGRGKGWGLAPPPPPPPGEPP